MARRKKEADPEISEEREEGSSNLFPGMKVPKEVETLARKMKEAELARKQAGAVEKEARENLCLLMEKKDFRRFQIEIEGVDYEFELDTSSRVKSKKVHDEAEE